MSSNRLASTCGVGIHDKRVRESARLELQRLPDALWIFRTLQSYAGCPTQGNFLWDPCVCVTDTVRQNRQVQTGVCRLYSCHQQTKTRIHTDSLCCEEALYTSFTTCCTWQGLIEKAPILENNFHQILADNQKLPILRTKIYSSRQTDRPNTPQLFNFPACFSRSATLTRQTTTISYAARVGLSMHVRTAVATANSREGQTADAHLPQAPLGHHGVDLGHDQVARRNVAVGMPRGAAACLREPAPNTHQDRQWQPTEHEVRSKERLLRDRQKTRRKL